MEYRDIHPVAQGLLDDETIGRSDIFQIDPAEAGFHDLHSVDEGFCILSVEFEIDRIDIGEALEQDRLAFHHRLGGKRTPIGKAEIALGRHRLRGDNLDFSGPAMGMEQQGFPFRKFQIGLGLVSQIISPHI